MSFSDPRVRHYGAKIPVNQETVNYINAAYQNGTLDQIELQGDLDLPSIVGYDRWDNGWKSGYKRKSEDRRSFDGAQQFRIGQPVNAAAAAEELSQMTRSARQRPNYKPGQYTMPVRTGSFDGVGPQLTPVDQQTLAQINAAYQNGTLNQLEFPGDTDLPFMIGYDRWDNGWKSGYKRKTEDRRSNRMNYASETYNLSSFNGASQPSLPQSPQPRPSTMAEYRQNIAKLVRPGVTPAQAAHKLALSGNYYKSG